MPTVVKSSSNLAKLGDISTFDVSSTAVPVDAADSSGSVPTFNVTLANGTDTEYLVGESVTVTSPSIGGFDGEVVNQSKAPNSNTYSLSVDSIMARLNSDLRAYPLADYAGTTEYTTLPIYCLEYWTQQLGLFYTKVPGDVLLYHSGSGHFGWFAKDYTLPLRTNLIIDPGGTTLSMISRYGRVWNGFGYDFNGLLNFPKDKYLATPIPQSPERLVFGADIYLDGTGRTASIAWQFRRSSGNKPALQISIDSEEGFRLRTADDEGAYSTRIISTQPKGDLYSVYASVSRTSGNTQFTLTIFNSAGVLVDSQTYTGTSNIKGNLALTTVKAYGALGGSGSDLTYGNMFISKMSAAPDRKYADAKSLTPGSKGANFMVGFSGNAWEHIKAYCSIYHLDIGYRDGKLAIGPRKRDITVGANLSEGRATIANREQARHVEIVNQNHTPTGSVVPKVMWKADSVYQVAVGEVQEFLVQTPHSILEVSQPVCVTGISPYPYTSGAGQYVVTGSDGYIVSPSFWADQGGKITTEITGNEGEVKIIIKGPDFDSPRAPYRISEGDAGRPALYVTGIGVLAKPETLKVGTGKARAAKDVGVTIDSPFVGNAKLAYNVAVEAAKTFATPETTVSIAEPIAHDGVSKLGTAPAGALIKMNGNVLRVTSANQTATAFSGTAKQFNTIYQLKRSFGGQTIKQQKDYYAGKTIGQVNIKPMKKAV